MRSTSRLPRPGLADSSSALPLPQVTTTSSAPKSIVTRLNKLKRPRSSTDDDPDAIDPNPRPAKVPTLPGASGRPRSRVRFDPPPPPPAPEAKTPGNADSTDDPKGVSKGLKTPSLRGSQNGSRTRIPLGHSNPNVIRRPTRATRKVAGAVTAAKAPVRPAASGIIAGKRTGLGSSASGGHSAMDGQQARVEMRAERSKVYTLRSAQSALETELHTAKTQEQEHRRDPVTANENTAQLKRAHAKEVGEHQGARAKAEREVKGLKEDLAVLKAELGDERATCTALKEEFSKQAVKHLTLETQLSASQALTRELQAEVEARLSSNSGLRLKLDRAEKTITRLEAEAHENELVRRRLHNMVQELKGNIRVYVRVRPPLPTELASNTPTAAVAYPDKRDHREIALTSSSSTATGTERVDTALFSFDRVFEPRASQGEVFEDIGQLVQSVTDGYNCTIFSYGQTGSGKTWTMEGGKTPETIGMIPRAVKQVFQTAESARAQGWDYTMEGQFLEIYNETINDLLGTGELDKRKHDIKHDKSGRTTVTEVVTIPLTGPSQVTSLLQRAQSRRAVATTWMNERSSRSHSVFTLRVSGMNRITGEACEGSLNLVDLAGSERLSSSGAANDKDRLKETQAINKSLSALGDVIAALGAGNGAHVPYRNSKLTYLLQSSLGGNSKTLMILNLSPMLAHYSESICSLRFATKVNNTTIGTARRQVRSTS